MSWRSTPLVIVVPLFFAVAPLAADAATSVSLVNPGGGAAWPGAAAVSTPEDLLNDPFTYNPNLDFTNLAAVPAGFLPNTAWNGGDTLFIANNNDADNFWRTDVTLGAGQTLDFIDIWGRSDYAGAEQSRHQALTISFYNAPGGSAGGGTLLAASPEYSGVSAKSANSANGSAYGRFDVAGLLNATQRGQVQSFEITHGASNLNDFLLLTEIRAGSGAITPPFPTLTINRDTGNAVLTNGLVGADLAFVAYDVVSDRGSLNASAWTSIADAGDGNSGGSIDSDIWVEFSASGSFSSLSEGELPGGDGLTLSTGESLNLGNIWRKSPYEDVSIQALQADGTFAPVLVEYVGNGGEAFEVGDLNFDGVINAADWPIFRSGLGSTFDVDSSLAVSYQQGDLDGDRDSDIADFRLFEAAFDGANGAGALATLAASVPEPTSLMLAGGVAIALGAMRRSRRAVRGFKLASLVVVNVAALAASHAHAQTFSLVPPPANPATAVTANSEYSAGYVAANMFDDASLTVNDLGVKAYTDADPQYAGVGVGPMHVFIDNGATINANWIAFAQRSGAIPTADRIGTMDFWFSDTDFGGVLPATAPQATVKFDDPLGSTIKHHPLLEELSGRYVAVKMTIHDISTTSPVNNIGGHEFRFLQGPSALVLQVDTGTGAMTLKNNGASAQAATLDGYQISSLGGSLNAGWTGLGGLTGFPEGNGSGNGWEAGGASDANLLAEAYLTGGSTVNVGASLSLGAGYNPAVNVQDLRFQYSYDNGIMTEGIVEYVSSGASADFDANGVVDGADFLRWQRGFGIATGAMKGQGDADNDGAVNAADLAIWKQTFGAGAATAAAAAVPEPSAFALAAVGAAAWGAGLRRRKA